MPGPSFRESWKAKGVNFGTTRIGVHAGPAMVGNFGGDRFFDYTAYGDTINTASRLEAANKFSAREFASARRWPTPPSVFAAGRSAISCCAGGANRFAPTSRCGGEQFEGPATAQYTEAFAKLEAGDAGAMPAFAALVGTHADDALAGYHLKRLLNGAKGVRMQLD